MESLQCLTPGLEPGSLLAAEQAAYERSDTEGRFELQGSYVFVTYNRSRVDDHELFERLLRESIAPRLPLLDTDTGVRATLQVYGARELHQDGTPHYHVLMRFEKGVHWRDARQKLVVMIPGENGPEPDTLSIRIKTKQAHESLRRFAEFCQAYVCKGGNEYVFGTWITELNAPVARAVARDEACRQAIAAEHVEDCVDILKRECPFDWVFRYPGQFLGTKRKRAVPYTPDFPVKPWRVPSQLLQWWKRNFAEDRGGRPHALLLIGPLRTGKTEWAMSWGRPGTMTKCWNLDVLKSDCTHVVLNDMGRDFKYWREMLGCQMTFTATGKYRPQQTVQFGKPVIWTCNEDNDPRRWKNVAGYIKAAGVVVVTIRIGFMQNRVLISPSIPSAISRQVVQGGGTPL